MTFPMVLRAMTFTALGFASAGAAQAQVVALNESVAQAGAQFSGDSPGYPITLAIPGLYVLSGPLRPPQGQSAIIVSAHGVTIDLNGQSIAYVFGCTLAANGATQCPSGSTVGIKSTGPGTTIRNGRIYGFTGAGIEIREGIVENMLVDTNKVGIKASNVGGPTGDMPSRISGTRVVRNLGSGIITTSALIERSVLSGNGQGTSGFGALLVDSMVIGNLNVGISNEDNAIGSVPSAMKGTVVRGNGVALGGTVRSLGGNLVNDAPF